LRAEKELCLERTLERNFETVVQPEKVLRKNNNSERKVQSEKTMDKDNTLDIASVQQAVWRKRGCNF